MSRYVITITPDTADAAEAASAQTTVRVDTSTGHTRITELTVRAADGDGLAPADLPAIDLDLLIRALAAPSTIRTLPTTGTPADITSVEPTDGSSAGVTAGPSDVEEPAARPRRAGKRTAPRKKAAKKATARKAVGRKAVGRKAAGRKSAAADTTGAKAAAAGRRARKAGDREVRAYRRMPEPAEVLAAYADSGSITGLAQHYDVPRHTANGWARRLRQQGHSIGRS